MVKSNTLFPSPSFFLFARNVVLKGWGEGESFLMKKAITD